MFSLSQLNLGGVKLASLCLLLMSLLSLVLLLLLLLRGVPAGESCQPLDSFDAFRFRSRSVASQDGYALVRINGYLELKHQPAPGPDRYLPLEVVSTVVNASDPNILELNTSCAKLELRLSGSSNDERLTVDSIKVTVGGILTDTCIIEVVDIEVPAKRHSRCLRTRQFWCHKGRTLLLSLVMYLFEFEIGCQKHLATRGDYTFAASDCD